MSDALTAVGPVFYGSYIYRFTDGEHDPHDVQIEEAHTAALRAQDQIALDILQYIIACECDGVFGDVAEELFFTEGLDSSEGTIHTGYILRLPSSFNTSRDNPLAESLIDLLDGMGLGARSKPDVAHDYILIAFPREPEIFTAAAADSLRNTLMIQFGLAPQDLAAGLVSMTNTSIELSRMAVTSEHPINALAE